MTVLEGIVRRFNNRVIIHGDDHDVRKHYYKDNIDQFLDILYRSHDEKKSNIEVRSGFDWIYVHIIHLRDTDKSIYK